MSHFDCVYNVLELVLVVFYAHQAASKLQSGSVTSEQLTRATFEQISSTKPLNAYVTLCEEQALSQAQQSDTRRKEGMWNSHIITVDCLGTNSFCNFVLC